MGPARAEIFGKFYPFGQGIPKNHIEKRRYKMPVTPKKKVKKPFVPQSPFTRKQNNRLISITGGAPIQRKKNVKKKTSRK
jgi:hypothetical protein